MKVWKILLPISLIIFAGVIGMSYIDSGYNSFLEQPLAVGQGQSALDFDALIESGAISTDQLAKGIISELVDERGNVILDEKGLKSTTQFISDSAFGSFADGHLVSSSAWADIPNCNLQLTIDRRSLIFITTDVSVSGQFVDVDDGLVLIEARPFLDRNVISFSISYSYSKESGTTKNDILHSGSISTIVSVLPGSHTLNVGARKRQLSGTNSGTANIWSCQVKYVILGK